MSDFERRLNTIEARNRRVELDKAWETSWTRRLSIASLSYIIISSYLYVIHNDTPFVNALVPAIGYLLSTLLLPQIRSVWQQNRKK